MRTVFGKRKNNVKEVRIVTWTLESDSLKLQVILKVLVITCEISIIEKIYLIGSGHILRKLLLVRNPL